MLTFSSGFLVQSIDGLGSFLKGRKSLFLGLLHHGGRYTTEQANVVLIMLNRGCCSQGTSEDIFVLLLWEVGIIVSVWMREFSWVISVILPGRVGSEVLWVSIGPVLDLEVSDGSAFVVVGDSHGSLISLVVDGLSSQVPLSFLSESFENVVWANLHNRYLSLKALSSLIFSNLSVATLWDELWLESHEFRLFHIWVDLGTVFVSKSLVFSIWEPVIVGLVMSVILIERIIKVTINPRKLRNMTKEEWHLGVLSWNIVVVLSQWVHCLVTVGVDELVSKVIVPLLIEVFRWVRRVKVNC